MSNIKYLLKNWSRQEINMFLETKEFLTYNFKDKISEDKMESYFEEIKNKVDRINDLDKQWVACNQEHEKYTVIKAMEKLNTIDMFLNKITKEMVSNIIDEICKSMSDKNIIHKPRIVFYILVLDQIRKKQRKDI
ncbi:hypothetical protein [Aliarcobacter butzleri]|uniref:hypothetical protein n=1 Tax=Aliarcobacter butzleri TaxID=28197 RepID=UPI001EDE1E7D|nr:hypothetical protein [Aliarcobacter butzleri]MCG3680286.1 hypothetical protein [Aliarcobacter butzleri]